MELNIFNENLAHFLSHTLIYILKVEDVLGMGRPEGVSFKEIHVIEAVGAATQGGTPARATDIAAILRVVPGTLTSAVDLLETKGYLTRVRDESDKRGVRIALTETGEQARLRHQDFYLGLANEMLKEMNEEEAQALIRGFGIMKSFFENKEETRKQRKKVKILVDSSCDIGVEVAERLNVTVIPMNVVFGDTVYRHDIDISSSEFYEKMSTSNISPMTTQLTPFDLEQAYREAAADGSEVVAIHLSSALSGTYQSAVLASREVANVYPVDSRSATLGMTLLVKAAAELRDSGKSAPEIAEELNRLSERVMLFAYIPTLKYLVRGGRLSTAAGVLGSVLNIYPIISVSDGVVKSIGKAKCT